MRIVTILIISLFLFLTGCAISHPPVTESPSAINETPQVATLSTQASPTPDFCPALESTIASQLGTNFPTLLMDIADYLERGKPIDEISTTFTQQSDDSSIIKVSAKGVDLAGNGNQDILVTIYDGSLVASSTGVFVFRKCVNGKYTIHYVSPGLENDFRGAPFGFVDAMPFRLLPDNSTQLIVQYGNMQSGRCDLETFLVVGLEESSWKTYLNDQVGCGYRDVTVVQNVLVQDADSSGRQGIVLTGTQWTAWGMYPFAFREVNLYYMWQKDQLQFEKRVYLPSTYRFHVLEDAQIALEAGDVQLALENYHKASTDNSLEDSLSWFEFDTLYVYPSDPASSAKASKIAHQYQTAFAYFRILVLSAEMISSAELQQRVQQLNSLYPVNTPGSEFAELAVAFQDEFSKTGSTQQACQKVNTLVENNYSDLTGPNGHIGNWGEPLQGEFTIEVICTTPP